MAQFYVQEMTNKAKNTAPIWSDVKIRLADFDRAGLLHLVQDLYATSKDNQAFLHARLGVGDDPVKPYKATISRWICPDVLKNQDISVSKAKRAISDYKKAIGHPEGVADLAVFYCEEALAFLGYCGMDDESYFSALVRMFEQAIDLIMALPETKQQPLLSRLDHVRAASQQVGWGVGDDFDSLWSRAGLESES